MNGGRWVLVPAVSCELSQPALRRRSGSVVASDRPRLEGGSPPDDRGAHMSDQPQPDARPEPEESRLESARESAKDVAKAAAEKVEQVAEKVVDTARDAFDKVIESIDDLQK